MSSGNPALCCLVGDSDRYPSLAGLISQLRFSQSGTKSSDQPLDFLPSIMSLKKRHHWSKKTTMKMTAATILTMMTAIPMIFHCFESLLVEVVVGVDVGAGVGAGVLVTIAGAVSLGTSLVTDGIFDRYEVVVLVEECIGVADETLVVFMGSFVSPVLGKISENHVVLNGCLVV